MRVVSGTFMMPGSDIDLFFGIGFIPDWVTLMCPNVTERRMEWTINMTRNATSLEGWDVDEGGAPTPNVIGVGIQIVRGGNVVTAAQASAGNCRTWDKLDYSKAVNHDPNTYEDIKKWTWVTGQTGYWDQICNTTYVDVGSFIWIGEANQAPKRYVIAALTGDGEGNGIGTAEVTLSETDVSSGVIYKITNKIDLKVMKEGAILPAGFKIDSLVDFLTPTSELAVFEAGTYDM